MLEERLREHNIDFSQHPEKIFKTFIKRMVQCAKRSIPRGTVKQYKPFWNETLNKLKTSRESFRLLAERTGQAWRKQCA